MTGEEKATVLVRDRERIAVDPIPRPELPFEVSGPEIVRRVRRDRHHARMLVWSAASTAAHQTATRQEIRGGARRRPVLNLVVSPFERPQQLARAPVGVQPPELAQQLRKRRANRRGRCMRASTAIGEPALAVGFEPCEPLIPDATAHAVACTELGELETLAQGIVNEL